MVDFKEIKNWNNVNDIDVAWELNSLIYWLDCNKRMHTLEDFSNELELDGGTYEEALEIAKELYPNYDPSIPYDYEEYENCHKRELRHINEVTIVGENRKDLYEKLIKICDNVRTNEAMFLKYQTVCCITENPVQRLYVLDEYHEAGIYGDYDNPDKEWSSKYDSVRMGLHQLKIKTEEIYELMIHCTEVIINHIKPDDLENLLDQYQFMYYQIFREYNIEKAEQTLAQINEIKKKLFQNLLDENKLLYSTVSIVFRRDIYELVPNNYEQIIAVIEKRLKVVKSNTEIQYHNLMENKNNLDSKHMEFEIFRINKEFNDLSVFLWAYKKFGLYGIKVLEDDYYASLPQWSLSTMASSYENYCLLYNFYDEYKDWGKNLIIVYYSSLVLVRNSYLDVNLREEFLESCEYLRNSIPRIIESLKIYREHCYADYDEKLFLQHYYQKEIKNLIFKRAAICLERMEEYDRAIAVCEDAIRYGYDDGTKGGMEARRVKLQNKLIRKKKL